jgi:hypothetical protein
MLEKTLNKKYFETEGVVQFITKTIFLIQAWVLELEILDSNSTGVFEENKIIFLITFWVLLNIIN